MAVFTNFIKKEKCLPEQQLDEVFRLTQDEFNASCKGLKISTPEEEYEAITKVLRRIEEILEQEAVSTRHSPPGGSE